MTLTALPARIDAQAAARAFMRPRWGNLFGLFAHRGIILPDQPRKIGALPRLERVWMPAYAIKLALTSRRGNSSTWVSVDASTGAFALFERATELESRDSLEETLDPALDEASAIEAGRHGLLQYLLRRRGQGDKPVVESVAEIRLYFAPVWILYYRRRRRRIDLTLLDGYTGNPMGSRAKQAVVNAFVARHKQRATRASCP